MCGHKKIVDLSKLYDSINREFGKVIKPMVMDEEFYCIGNLPIPEFRPPKYEELKSQEKEFFVFPYWEAQKETTLERAKNDIETRINSFLGKFTDKKKMAILWRFLPEVDHETCFETKREYWVGFARFYIGTF